MKWNPANLTVFSKKKMSFILPAVLTGLLVFDMLPQTQVTLQKIPERLTLVEEVTADTGTEDQAKSGIKRSDKKEDNGTQALGDYEDGVYTGTSQGYGGPITVEVTVKEGQITDVKIVSAPGETDPYFSLAQSVIEQVKQMQTWEVDTASGATYSSRGILGAIQNAMTGETVENAPAPKVEPKGTKQQDTFKEPKGYKDGTYTGTAQGFGGPITVKVTIKDGKIKDISIQSASGETSSYLNSAKSVISRILKKGSPNVDTVSGATYSSTGIINAVKRALTRASADGRGNKTKEKKQKKKKTKQTTPSANAAAQQDSYQEPAAYKDGTYYGTAEGFGGEIKVKVIISEGKLAGITIENAAGETAEYLNKAKAVISTMLQKGSPNVDSISGATYSSTGIINAVKRAMSQAALTGSGTAGNGSQSAVVTPANPAVPTIPADPSVMPSETLKDGVYTGTGTGYGGDIVVQMTVSGGRMTDIQITSAEDETAAYFNRAKALVTNILNRQSTDVDIISGATYSSQGIIEAVKKAAAKASGTEEKPDDESGNPGTGGHEGGGAGGGTGEPDKVVYKDGTYNATGWCVDDAYGDFEYEITVQITVKDGAISRCDVSFGEDRSVDPEENDYYIGRAMNGASGRKGIPAQVVSKQSADVDIVGGATYTSTTIRNLAAGILNEIKITAAEETKKSSSAKAARVKASDKESSDLSEDGQSDVRKPVEAAAGTAPGDEQTVNQSEFAEADGTENQNNEAEETTEKQSVTNSEPEESELASEETSAVEEKSSEKPEPKQKVDSKSKTDSDKKKAEEEEKTKAEAEKKKAEEAAKKKAEEEKKQAEAAAKAKAAEEEAVAKAKAASQAAQAVEVESDEN